MKKLLDKKGTVFDDISQGMFSIPRLFLIVFVAFLIALPTGCFSQNQELALRKVKLQEKSIALAELKICLEKEGLVKEKLSSCFNRNNIGIKITSNSDKFFINENNFDEQFCRLSNDYICPKDNFLIKINNEFQEIQVEMVINLE